MASRSASFWRNCSAYGRCASGAVASRMVRDLAVLPLLLRSALLLGVLRRFWRSGSAMALAGFWRAEGERND